MPFGENILYWRFANVLFVRENAFIRSLAAGLGIHANLAASARENVRVCAETRALVQDWRHKPCAQPECANAVTTVSAPGLMKPLVFDCCDNSVRGTKTVLPRACSEGDVSPTGAAASVERRRFEPDWRCRKRGAQVMRAG